VGGGGEGKRWKGGVKGKGRKGRAGEVEERGGWGKKIGGKVGVRRKEGGGE